MLSRFEFENRGLSDEKLANSKVSVENRRAPQRIANVNGAFKIWI